MAMNLKVWISMPFAKSEAGKLWNFRSLCIKDNKPDSVLICPVNQFRLVIKPLHILPSALFSETSSGRSNNNTKSIPLLGAGA